MLLILDSGPLGVVSNPSANRLTQEALEWVRAHQRAGDELVIPEIADYEVRRELLRAGKTSSVVRLDELLVGFLYLPLTTPVMHDAASLWADARNAGRPTADAAALDGDVILAAQARRAQLDFAPEPVVVATSNVAHLARYTDARLWSEI